MALVSELLNMGLVTTRDPALLEAGELSKCDNAIYKANSQSLFRPPAMTLLGTVTGGQPITGLRVCKFKNNNAYLLLQSNTHLWVSSAALSAPFTLISGTDITVEGADLVAVRHQDRYFTFIGLGYNLVLRNDGTTRKMGMQPITETPGYSVSSLTGNWNLALGYYEYWVTEVAEISENGGITTIESTFSGVPLTVNMAATTTKITINRPARVNPTATKWYVYRSAVKTSAAITLFPVGVLVGKLDINTTTFSDGASADTGFIFCSARPADVWTNPGNVSADDGAYATAMLAAASPTTPASLTQVYHNLFGATPVITDSIQGIEVELEAKASAIGTAAPHISCYISDSTGPIGNTKSAVLSTTDKITTMGGPTDLWGANLIADSFKNGSFKLSLVGQNYGATGVTISVDYLKIKVYYGGGATTSVTAFPAVNVVINGVENPVGEDGPPPIATTACVFEDAIVSNDTSNPTYVRWSAPGKPESWPSVYYLDTTWVGYDTVSCNTTIGEHLICFLRNSSWRLNYLPNEDDAVFANRGQAKALIDPVNGCIGPLATAQFSGADGHPLLAFISNNGLMATDGFTTNTLTEDINWSAILTLNDLTKYRLINKPDRWELILYISDGSGVRKALHFNYHPTHLKKGRDGQMKLKVSGPVLRQPTGSVTYIHSADVSVTPSGVATTYFGHSDGKIYYDDDAGTAFFMDPDIRTRRLMFAGTAQEFRVTEAYIHHQACATAFTITPYLLKTSAAEITGATKSMTGNFIGQSRIPLATGYTTEGLRLGISTSLGGGSPAAFQFDFLTFNVPNIQGKEDSVK